MGGTRDGFVPQVNNVRRKDICRGAVMKVDQVFIVGGGSAISVIAGSEGATTDETNGTESIRSESSGAESDNGVSC